MVCISKCRTQGKPNIISVLLAALKQCSKNGDLEQGEKLHRDAVGSGCHRNKYVCNALVSMYGKCGAMMQARSVFDSMVYRDAVSWNSLMLGYVENGKSLIAINLFESMGCEPTSVTYVSALKACADLASERQSDRRFCLEKGMAIHAQARAARFDGDILVATTLVHMYSKCGSMLHARGVFDSMNSPTVITWNSLTLGYVENGESRIALELFTNMNCEPNYVSFVAVFKACAALADRELCLDKGMEFHRQARERGFDKELYVANTLLDMYGKCRMMVHARGVFDNIEVRNVVSWNSLILGYVENGKSSVAIELYMRMNCKRDSVSFVAGLKACGGLASEKQLDRKSCLQIGRVIHTQCGHDTDMFVASNLIDMYSKCGSMQHAQDVFDNMIYRDIVSWNILILGYVENVESSVALDLFTRIDCEPEAITFAAALKACAEFATLEKGEVVHRQAKEAGYDADLFVANTLIDMYCKCGSMFHARDVFDGMSHRNAVSWNNLILGYVENEEGLEAMDLFMSMECEPSSVTFIAALKICGNVGALAGGRTVHAQLCKLGLDQDQVISTALVDFYGKCGSVSAAEEVFNTVHSQDTASWNALLAGYSSLGDIHRVSVLLENMLETGLQMNGITFVLILTAYSHRGMVEEGERCFKSLRKYGISPSPEHYHCIVDILGRANKVQEALSIIDSMPFESKSVAWTTLLGACRNLSNEKVSKTAFAALVSSKDRSYAASAYVLMSDICKNLNAKED